MGFLGLSTTRLFLLACLLLAGYFIYTAAIGTIRQREQNADHEAALAELVELQVKRAYLLAVLEYTASDTYVEQAARRELGYVRAGEIPFVVLSPAAPPAQQVQGDWWERLFPQ